MSLPSLPPVDAGRTGRSPQCQTAFQLLQDYYFTAFNLISNSNIDAQRATYHHDLITGNAVPILLALESAAEEESIPKTWFEECVGMFGALLVQLREIKQTEERQYVFYTFLHRHWYLHCLSDQLLPNIEGILIISQFLDLCLFSVLVEEGDLGNSLVQSSCGTQWIHSGISKCSL